MVNSLDCQCNAVACLEVHRRVVVDEVLVSSVPGLACAFPGPLVGPPRHDRIAYLNRKYSPICLEKGGREYRKRVRENGGKGEKQNGRKFIADMK